MVGTSWLVWPWPGTTTPKSSDPWAKSDRFDATIAFLPSLLPVRCHAVSCVTPAGVGYRTGFAGDATHGICRDPGTSSFPLRISPAPALYGNG